jgi:hypothetical protein
MRLYSALLFLGWLLSTQLVTAQSVYISRLSPGNPQHQHDVLFRVDLFNESDQYADLSGYVVVTRYFALRLPAKTFVAPYARLRIGRNDYNGDLDLAFSALKTFTARPAETDEDGDYIALLDPSLELVDGFLFSPRAAVNFLPTETWLSPPQGERLRLRIPDESDYRWHYLRSPSDPAMAFVCIDKRWRPNSRTNNLLPATQYRDLSARFVDGIATIKWRTLFERDCYYHVLERSTDGKNYRPIEQVSGPINQEEPFEYTLYDTQVERDRLYYYRISYTDKFGYANVASPTKLRTQETAGEFTFDVIRAEIGGSRSFDVRFSSKAQQQVRVKLMDEALREVSVLFYGTVEAERQTLINYQRELATGKYYLIVSTEKRRYYEPLIIE